ncbi:response regulator transcription factor [Blautia sp.]|uniref:response regulator transcription factor n=1 Tax=Blautia sp. TaxID=1955243 RepID=UPI0025907EA9|nr:response regulator transcription factor [Blautia sp.]
MGNRIIIIASEHELYMRSLTSVEQWAEIYEAKGVQDALSHLTVFSYHLILIAIQQEPEFICQFVETIRKLVSAPVMILLPEKTKERMTFVEAGADVVLEEPCEPEEIRLQAYALIRRYNEWGSKEKKEDGGIVVGPLRMNSLTRTLYWYQAEISVVKREFDFLYLLASNPGRVYTYSQIYRIVWQEYPQDDITNMIYCMVHRLKKKLKDVDMQAYNMIHSVKEVGYCLKLHNE